MVVRKIIERILEVGQTSVTITDTDIPGSLVRTYSNDPDLMPVQIVLTGSTLKIDYEAQTTDKYVAVELVKQGLDIIDNLTSDDTDAALSANQGKELKTLIDNIVVTGTLAGLDDVNLSDLAAGDTLVYDAVSQKWINSKMISCDIITNTTGQFSTITGGLLESCMIDITPVQTGSGTPSPSNVRPINGHTSINAENVGKNKLPNNAITTIINGITWTVEKDSDGNVVGVDANGTATGESNYYFYGSAQALNPLGQIANGMILSGCPSGGSSSSYYMVAGSLNSRYATDSGNGDTLSNVLQSGIRVICRITNGYTVNHVKFRPMIRKATDSAEFKPYLGKTYTVNLGQTVYGGKLDIVNGSGYDEWVNITSYNGETITEPWLSSMDEYVSGTTPTTGAQVVYKKASSTLFNTAPTHIETLIGENNVLVPLAGQSLDSLSYRKIMSWPDVLSSIDNKVIYSTTETLIGKWNNDDLYRKIFEYSGTAITCNPNTWTKLSFITGVNEIKDARAFDSNGTLFLGMWGIVDGDVAFYNLRSTAVTLDNNSEVMIEYTKSV